MTLLSRRFALAACLGLALGLSLPLALGDAGACAHAAANPASGAQEEAIDISAEESLEWHEDTQTYFARGQARAVRGTMVVEADLLTAKARPKADAPKQDKAKSAGKDASKSASGAAAGIDYLTAEGHVRIADGARQAFGQRAEYDVNRRAMKMTGDNLKLVTEKNVVTARDSLEYYEDKRLAIARGRAVATQGESRVEADQMTAQFAPQGAGGAMTLTEIAAKGNVVVVTKDGSVSRGDDALYNVNKDAAILSGHVRIARGQTQLAGDSALVDFKSGQSRLINSGSGRVRALLPASGAGKSNAKDGKKP